MRRPWSRQIPPGPCCYIACGASSRWISVLPGRASPARRPPLRLFRRGGRRSPSSTVFVLSLSENSSLACRGSGGPGGRSKRLPGFVDGFYHKHPEEAGFALVLHCKLHEAHSHSGGDCVSVARLVVRCGQEEETTRHPDRGVQRP